MTELSDLETALRHALAKGDSADPAFRQRVYRAAIETLQRSFAKAANANPQRVAEQKRQLAETIRSIERSFGQPDGAARPQPRPREPEAPSVDIDAAPRRNGPARVEPPVVGLRAEPRRAPAGDGIGAIGRDDRAAPERRRRAPFAMLFAGAVLVGLVGIGGWWIVSTGAFQSAAERDTSVPNPPRQLDNESFNGVPDPGTSRAPARIPTGADVDEGWVTLFRPSDPTTLSLSGDATAAIESDTEGEYALIDSPDTDSAVSIDVPPGVLDSLAGKTAQFSLIARAETDAPTQMSVTCDLPGLGDCGRLRFSVTQNDGEFLFRVDLPAGRKAASAGTISIITDIDNQGRAVKLLGARVRDLAGS